MKLTLKTLSFTKWQKKSSIADSTLIQAIVEIKKGLVDADLGSGIFKKELLDLALGKDQVIEL